MDEKWGRCELWKYIQPPSQLCSFGLRLWTVCTLIALVDMLQAGIRTSIHLHLHPLGELLFFSFYCERVWGWCLMPLGKPGPVTQLFVAPVFFFKHLVWVGATPRVLMNTLIPPRLTSISPCTFPTPTYCQWAKMWLNVIEARLNTTQIFWPAVAITNYIWGGLGL